MFWIQVPCRTQGSAPSSHSVACLFNCFLVFLMMSFVAQKFIILTKSSLSISSAAYAHGIVAEKPACNPRSRRFLRFLPRLS